MFGGGKKQQPLEQDEQNMSPVNTDPSVRIFVMPEALRGKTAIFPEQLKPQEKKEELAPLIIPIAVPTENTETKKTKSRVSPLLLFPLVIVLMGGTGVGVWWYLVTLPSPVQPVDTIGEEVDPPVVVTPTEPYPGTDTDSDGLTNVEELLYGTDFRSPDTDGDTFLDGNEVFHRYDPNGLAPSTLLDTGAVRVLERSDIPFTVYYPASWSITADAAQAVVTFRAAAGAEIVLTYQAKDVLVSLRTWMQQQGVSLTGTEETMTKEGFEARTANEGRTMYVDLGDWAVSAVYELGEGNYSIDFLQTFKMMMNSVTIINKESGATQEDVVPITGSSLNETQSGVSAGEGEMSDLVQ